VNTEKVVYRQVAKTQKAQRIASFGFIPTILLGSVVCGNANADEPMISISLLSKKSGLVACCSWYCYNFWELAENGERNMFRIKFV
jgi:hypothetical protein